MNEFGPKTGLANDELMQFVAKQSKSERDGGHRRPNEEAQFASPQAIGDAISRAAQESDAANADDPTFLEKILKRPEGALFMLGIIAIGSGFLSSGAGQEILRKIPGQ